MTTNSLTWIKPAIWGGIIGAVGITITGFIAGWFVSSSNARHMAQRQSETAVIEALAPICVAQFRDQADGEESTHLAALAEQGQWQRGTYVEKQGWATMPGSEQPAEKVAAVCASMLMELRDAAI